MDLEKAYDAIDRYGMWQRLRVYGVAGKFLKAVHSFYVDIRACFRVGNDVSEWFPVNVGLYIKCWIIHYTSLYTLNSMVV